jgi:hypothetical protein
MRLLVFAKDLNDFKAWCWDRQIPLAHATYVHRVDQLHAVNWRNARIARTANAAQHPASADIETYISNHPSLAPAQKDGRA